MCVCDRDGAEREKVRNKMTKKKHFGDISKRDQRFLQSVEVKKHGKQRETEMTKQEEMQSRGISLGVQNGEMTSGMVSRAGKGISSAL